jgi:hypothetical protein
MDRQDPLLTRSGPEDIILAHVARYPLMETTDVIKLLFQMTFGPAHFTMTPTFGSVKEWILMEHQVMGVPRMPMVEAIGDGFVRISLATLDTDGMTADRLTRLFLLSMDSIQDHDRATALFTRRLDLFVEMVMDGRLPYDASRTASACRAYLDGGIRPVSHSQSFRNAYNPHYRVVKADLLTSI